MTLAELFADAECPFVEWHGDTVYATYELGRVPSRLLIKFERAKDSKQGVRLKARGWQLEVNGIKSADIVLWCDTSPTEVTIKVTSTYGSKGTAASLKFWNVWRGGLDVTQAWLGNAGMRVRELDGDVLLVGCSDGHGAVAFDDLEFAVVARDEP